MFRKEKPVIQQREAMTDRLVRIIANIQMERRSGRLIVRRGEGLTSEEGILMFIQGQVTEARVGRRSGSDALNWLSTWGQAYYVFASLVAEQETSLETLALAPTLISGLPTTSPLQSTAPVSTDKLEHESFPITANAILYSTVACAEATARIDRAGLSRAHRHLYLLINGQRTALELVPLVGRKVEEVRNMLHDLEWLGIIRVGHPPLLMES